MAFRNRATARTLATFLALSAITTEAPALARSHHASHHHAARIHQFASAEGGAHVIQCVAFARADTGIQISGNARNWWDNAAGIYDRGNTPEIGSVLSFRATQRMHLGHVAVVSSVVSPRVLQIDQSHWASGGISRDVTVVDVSEDNDWTQVRVAIGHGGDFGAIYPTDGFIYARPDRSGVIRPNVARRATVLADERQPVDTDGGPVRMPITIASSSLTDMNAVDRDNLAAQDAEIAPSLHRHHASHRRHEITLEVAEAPEPRAR